MRTPIYESCVLGERVQLESETIDLAFGGLRIYKTLRVLKGFWVCYSYSKRDMWLAF